MRTGNTRTVPIRVTLVNELPAVERLVTGMLAAHADRVEVVGRHHDADVALVELRAERGNSLEHARALKDTCAVAHVVLLADSIPPLLVDAARAVGASGLVLTTTDGAALANALERVVAGERVGLEHDAPQDPRALLTERECEVLALLSRGLTNQEIGRELFLGVETVRTYVRSILRKLGVANRTQAAVRSGRAAG